MKMRLLLLGTLAIILFLFNSLVTAEVIELNENIIHQEYVFSRTNRYIFPRNVTFSFLHCSVIMEPGTVLEMGAFSNFTFHNTSIMALGTTENPVIITSKNDNDGNKFGCIDVSGADSTKSVEMRHVKITNGGNECENFIHMAFLKSVIVDHVHISNCTTWTKQTTFSHLITFQYVTSKQITNNVFVDDASKTTNNMHILNLPSSLQNTDLTIANNTFMMKKSNVITLTPGGNSYPIYIGGNMVQGGSTFLNLVLKSNTPQSSITIESNELRGTKSPFQFNFEVASNQLQYNNTQTIIQIKRNEIYESKDSGYVFDIHMEIPSRTYRIRYLLNMENNLIHNSISSEAFVNLRFAGVKEVQAIAAHFVDINFNFNTMTSTSITTSTSKFLKFSTQAGVDMQIKSSDVLDARYNYYGTNNYTTIANRMQGLVVADYVPFLTELPPPPGWNNNQQQQSCNQSSSSTMVLQQPKNCNLREDITCPLDYGVIEEDDFFCSSSSTCLCSTCPQLNCTRYQSECDDGFESYEKKEYFNLCGQCSCRKICPVSVTSSSCEQSLSCQSGYHSVLRLAANESECDTCQCVECPKLNCSNGSLVCPQGFELFEKYDPSSFECSQCACRKICPNVTSCENHSGCPTGYKSVFKEKLLCSLKYVFWIRVDHTFTGYHESLRFFFIFVSPDVK